MYINALTLQVVNIRLTEEPSWQDCNLIYAIKVHDVLDIMTSQVDTWIYNPCYCIQLTSQYMFLYDSRDTKFQSSKGG